jgi:membrane associated rhomboid family serine protease
MFFPIGDDQIKGGYYPLFSYAFLLVNMIVFMYQANLSEEEMNFFLQQYSTIPTYIVDGHHWPTLISSMFLHGSLMHLLGNLLFLWVFADNIEATIGNIPFLFFYLISGILASLSHVYFNLDSAMPSLGASGAISAVMGAYLVMFPRSKVKVLIFLVIILRRITMSAFAFLGIWIGVQIFSTIQNFGISAEQGGTAWFAHLGGFGFGLLMGLIFRTRVETIN